MSGETAVACCCTGRLWYALKCPEFYTNYCCEPGCEGAPNRIEFCESYLASIGVPMPTPDPTKCYYISYNCCIYVLTDFEQSACPKPGSPWPTNVGTLAKVGNRRSPPQTPCCFPQSTDHYPVGGIGNLHDAQGNPIISAPTAPCSEMIAECYNFNDQAGTVVGKEVRVTSTLKGCITQFGVPWQTRCDHGPPIKIYPFNKSIEQKVNVWCLCCQTLNGQCAQPGPCLSGCPNEQKQYWQYFLNCNSDPNCVPDYDCCGGSNPCDDDPHTCDSFEDPAKSYAVRTCYSINNCNNDQVEDVLKLTFPCCFATNRGVDCTNANAVTALFVNGIVNISQETVNTGWGTFTNIPGVNVCGLKVICFSGNAGNIAERINYRIGGLVQATGIGPWSAWFWFGQRQSCISCAGASPNTRPPASFGDTIYVDRAVYDAASQTISVYLKGVSPRWYACAAQAMHPTYDCRGDFHYVQACAISSKSQAVPYQLHCLSFPEYAFGERYEMRAVEEIATQQQSICIDINYYTFAPDCLAVSGFPLDNVYLNDVLVQYGWRYLCPQMPIPQTKCRCYPFTYNVAPCCPQGQDCERWNAEHPLPQPCLYSFQSPQIYCQTDATVIQLQ
jgi:hypothetical protein